MSTFHSDVAVDCSRGGWIQAGGVYVSPRSLCVRKPPHRYARGGWKKGIETYGGRNKRFPSLMSLPGKT